MAYRFTGTSTQGFLSTATGNAWLATEPFCVSAWVYVNATSTGVQTCIGFSGTATDTYRLVGISAAGAAIAESRTATNVRTANSPSTVRPGWNHIWGQFASITSRQVQLNGDGDGTNTQSIDPGKLEHLGIGILPTTPNILPRNGVIGEIAVWKDFPNVRNEQIRAMVKYLACGGDPFKLTALRNSLVFYRPFDDPMFDRGRNVAIKNNDRRLTFLDRPTQNLKTPFRFAQRTRWPTWWLRLLNFAVGGGVQNNVTLTAAASTAALLIRRAGKGLAASIVGSITDILQVGKALITSAAVSITFEALKVFSVSLVAAATAVASITLQVGKIISATASKATTSMIQVGKSLAADASGLVAFTRRSGLTLAANTTAVAGNVMQVGKTLTVGVVNAATAVASFVISITLAVAASVSVARVLNIGKRLLALVSAAAVLPDYFVDSVNGSDTNNGTYNFPFATIGKALSLASNGQTIALKRGSYFRESVVLPVGLSFIDYGSGPLPIVSGGVNLKAQAWTDESATGPNIWSTLVTRDGLSGNNDIAMLWTNEVKGNIGKTAANLCVAAGDWFHTTGGGAQKLYIFNSGGNPANDPAITTLEYSIKVRGFYSSGLDSVGIINVQIQRFWNNLYQLNTTSGAYSNLILNGSVTDCCTVRGGTVANFSNCVFNQNGVHKQGADPTNGAGHCFLIGGISTEGAADTYITDCTVNSHEGEDVIQIGNNNSIVSNARVTITRGTFRNTDGENCFDLKNGYFTANNATFISSSITGGGNQVAPIHVVNQKCLLNDCWLETQNTSADVIIVNDNRTIELHRCIVISGATGAAAGRNAINIGSTAVGAGDGSIVEGCLVLGPLDGAASTGCIRLGKGSSHQILNNTCYARKSAGYGLLVPNSPPAGRHTVTNNIFSTTGTAATDGYPVISTSTAGVFDCILSYNHYFRSDNSANAHIRDSTTPQDYSAAQVTTLDANGTTGDPLFYDPSTTAFTLKLGSPCRDPAGDPSQDGLLYRASIRIRALNNRNKGSEDIIFPFVFSVLASITATFSSLFSVRPIPKPPPGHSGGLGWVPGGTRWGLRRSTWRRRS